MQARETRTGARNERRAASGEAARDVGGAQAKNK